MYSRNPARINIPSKAPDMHILARHSPTHPLLMYGEHKAIRRPTWTFLRLICRCTYTMLLWHSFGLPRNEGLVAVVDIICL